MRALVVDDEPDVAALLAHHLAGLNFDVTTAGTAEDALAVLTEGTCDVAIVDLLLPGMDGTELIERLRVLHADLPVIATSVLRGSDVLSAHADAVLPKPFRSADVGSAVARARDARRALSTPHAEGADHG